MDSTSLSFIRFQCILHDSGVLCSAFWSFYKLKRGNLISGGKPREGGGGAGRGRENEFCRKSELFGPLFCFSILKVLSTQFLPNSLNFNAFCMIQEYFLRVLKFLQIKEGGSNFWGEPILQRG